jgi:CheY-like chemotaxis protein
MKVLVVEDEIEVGLVFRDLLLELGHEPVLARSAEAAVGSLQDAKPDAVILDMDVPGVSGRDFLQLRPIREFGLPIVAVSGVATEAEARECLRLGAFDFVGKPVPVEQLRVVLASIEPYALLHRRTEAGERDDRRRAPRVPLSVPVRVTEYDGAKWETPSVNVRPFGMKVRSGRDTRAGAAATLTFTPPDGGLPIQVQSLLVRKDHDGDAFYFVNLTGREFHRLSNRAFQQNWVECPRIPGDRL